MSLTEEFKKAIETRRPSIENDDVLILKQKRHDGEVWTAYDFMQRNVTVTFYSIYKESSRYLGSGTYAQPLATSFGSVSVTPFSQVDRETLEGLHAYMTDAGKKPIPLPNDQPGIHLPFQK